MGRKCSVFGCKTGYKSNSSTEKISVYGFPKDPDRCREWLACLPNVLKFEDVTSYMGVCALHWPQDVSMVKTGSRVFVPQVPPSVFPNVPQSCIPTSSSSSTNPRPTKKSTQASRAVDTDEMAEFLRQDSFCPQTFDDLFTDKLKKLGFLASCSKKPDDYVFLSTKRTGPLPEFCVNFTVQRTNESVFLNYEAFYNIKKIQHPLIREIHCWSQLDEVLRFVSCLECDPSDKKLTFINRVITLMNAPRNSRIYSHEDLLLAFSWYSQSRSLYVQLRDYLHLPSVSTLKKITSVAHNTTDDKLFHLLFRDMEERCTYCILIIDEVYVKASVSYRGGTIFGYAVDYPEKVATTLLCIMVKCFFSGQTFLAKILPCHALKADFQFHQVCNIIQALEKRGAKVVAIVNDNNRVNQSFLKSFKPMDTTAPWKVESPADPSRPLFLMYDTVHLFKNIRNNWLSEKQKMIEFTPSLELEASTSEVPTVVARWTDLKELADLEATTAVKLPTLTKASVEPSNIEKQKVSLVLNIFSEKTSAALKASAKSNPSWKDTAIFIDYVIRLWKVFNTKNIAEHTRFRDTDRTPIDLSPAGDIQRGILKFWAESADRMSPSSHQHRVKSLTKDTATALGWTCRCLLDISNYLLTTDTALKHSFITVGFFQQDDIEHHFAHFRMAAGSNYYITAQDVAHTHAQDRAKLMLLNDPDITQYSVSQHACDVCDKPLTNEELINLDDLPVTTCSLSHDERMALFFIGGYVASKHTDFKGDPSCVPDQVRLFTETVSHGGLSFPSHELFVFIMYAYTFIMASKEHSCRSRLVRIISDFPAMFHLNISLTKAPVVRIVNILLKRLCLHKDAATTDQSRQRKIAKLTSTRQ